MGISPTCARAAGLLGTLRTALAPAPSPSPRAAAARLPHGAPPGLGAQPSSSAMVPLLGRAALYELELLRAAPDCEVQGRVPELKSPPTLAHTHRQENNNNKQQKLSN